MGTISTTAFEGSGNTEATLITQTSAKHYTVTNAAVSPNSATTNTFVTSSLIEMTSYSVPSYTTQTALEMELEASSKITCKVTASGGAIYGAITNREKKFDAKDGAIVTSDQSGVLDKTGKLKEGSKTIIATSLPKNNYYIRLYNDNRFGTHTGTYLVTIE